MCKNDPQRSWHCYRLLRTVGKLSWITRDFIPFEIKITELSYFWGKEKKMTETLGENTEEDKTP